MVDEAKACGCRGEKESGNKDKGGYMMLRKNARGGYSVLEYLLLFGLITAVTATSVRVFSERAVGGQKVNANATGQATDYYEAGLLNGDFSLRSAKVKPTLLAKGVQTDTISPLVVSQDVKPGAITLVKAPDHTLKNTYDPTIASFDSSSQIGQIASYTSPLEAPMVQMYICVNVTEDRDGNIKEYTNTEIQEQGGCVCGGKDQHLEKTVSGTWDDNGHHHTAPLNGVVKWIEWIPESCWGRIAKPIVMGTVGFATGGALAGPIGMVAAGDAAVVSSLNDDCYDIYGDYIVQHHALKCVQVNNDLFEAKCKAWATARKPDAPDAACQGAGDLSIPSQTKPDRDCFQAVMNTLGNGGSVLYHLGSAFLYRPLKFIYDVWVHGWSAAWDNFCDGFGDDMGATYRACGRLIDDAGEDIGNGVEYMNKKFSDAASWTSSTASKAWSGVKSFGSSVVSGAGSIGSAIISCF